jgi:hypothetical protein
MTSEVRRPWHRGTVTGGMGTVPAAAVDTTRQAPAPATLSAKDAQALMFAELLGAVREVTAASTELTSRIGRHGATNGVLDVVLLPLDVEGKLVLSYPVVVGSVVVTNHGTAAPMVVGLSTGQAPTIGRGIGRVDPGQRLTMPIGGRSVAVWGTPGDLVGVQVYTGLQPIGGGL